MVAANLDFSASRHPALHAYERGLVKEGVGAGGACLAALLAPGATQGELQAAIDAAYDLLIEPVPSVSFRTLDAPGP